MRKRLLAALMAFFWGAGFAQAEEPSSPADQYFIGNTLFVFYHELGHALIDKLGAPVLGREEDAADQLATLVLIDMGSDEALGEPAINAALGWLVSWQKAGEQPDKAAYWDVHSLDIQRYANIMCLIYGGNPEAYAGLIGADGVPQERAESCPSEYQQSAASWGAILDASLLPDGAPAPEKPSFALVYQVPQAAELKDMFDGLKSEKLFEGIADDLNASLALEAPVEIAIAQCDEANAFYDPETSRLTMCLELLQVFREDAVTLAQAEPQ